MNVLDLCLQFIYDNRSIYRNIYKLNIHEAAPQNNNNICINFTMLDLNSFLFKKEFEIDNENENENMNEPINIRIWSDDSSDIIYSSVVGASTCAKWDEIHLVLLLLPIIGCFILEIDFILRNPFVVYKSIQLYFVYKIMFN